MRRRARTAVVAGTASLLVGATATFGAASAGAAEASAPIVGKCGDTVKGEPGTPVKVAGIKLGKIPESGRETLVGKVPLAGGLLGGLTKCTVTAVADVSEPVSNVTKPVARAADPVTKALPGPVKDTVDRVTGQREQKAQPAPRPQATEPQASPQDDVSRSPVVAQSQPTAPPRQFGPFTPAADFNVGALQRGVYDFGSVSQFDYSNLFTSAPGSYNFGAMDFGKLPRGDLFGSAPGFGLPGSTPSATQRDVAAAGQAEALPSRGNDRVALPVLVAVLALSGVTAALVRTWVHGPSSA